MTRDRDPGGADKDPGKVVLELKPEQSVGVLAREGPVGSGQWGGGEQVKGMGREGGSERRPVRWRARQLAGERETGWVGGRPNHEPMAVDSKSIRKPLNAYTGGPVSLFMEFTLDGVGGMCGPKEIDWRLPCSSKPKIDGGWTAGWWERWLETKLGRCKQHNLVTSRPCPGAWMRAMTCT